MARSRRPAAERSTHMRRRRSTGGSTGLAVALALAASGAVGIGVFACASPPAERGGGAKTQGARATARPATAPPAVADVVAPEEPTTAAKVTLEAPTAAATPTETVTPTAKPAPTAEPRRQVPAAAEPPAIVTPAPEREVVLKRSAFTPGTDAFSDDAVLDLRGLNEKVAGQSGFVRRSRDGNSFVLGNGKPARFWAINLNPVDKQGEAERTARFLAKRGVNIARVFAQISPDHKNPVTEPNRGSIDRIWRTVSELKKQGIYSIISPYWAGTVGKIPSTWGIETNGPQEAWGYLFFHERLQTGYKAWMKALYTEKNPYTGIPLARDSSVALIQLQNEDSLLFWTMVGFLGAKGEPWQMLCGRFGDWAKKKYGSIAKAKAAWGGQGADGDDPAAGRLGFYQVWEIINQPPGPKGDRMADQVAFWSQTMFDFHREMGVYLRKELGCKQLVNAGNWRTADTVKLNDLEHWTYTANEVVATNRYFGGAHVGKDCGWAIQAGDHFTNESCLTDPRSLPTNVKQVVGYPFMVTETSWTSPNLYESEGPALIAAYSSLIGLDAVFWNTGGGGFSGVMWPYPPKKIYKWSVMGPMAAGQFPAAALMFRKGYVKAGAAVVHEERSFDDMAHELTPLIAEEKAYDPNRDQEKIPGKSSVKTSVDPLAFLVGRVEVVLGGRADPARNKVIDLGTYIDNTKKKVKSVTGELELDWDRGLFTVDAPKAQVASGFLGEAGPIALADVTVESKNPYITVMVVSLDGAPIKSSSRVLVQIGTTSIATGWKIREATFTADKKQLRGFRIDDVGHDPWSIENPVGTVTVRNRRLTEATILDPNGMAVGKARGRREGGAYELTLPSDALYVVLSSKALAKR